ncbi:MAG TPA: branched-chain amino acid ABC transporter permease [Lachnospiraceae bacterium]|nr:branched-chain amino acid ABC transporter permease [Lachnospiraceae bacterium]
MKDRLYSTTTSPNARAFREGIRDGIPIGLGYFAVAFALGVAAKDAGLNPLQGFFASILCLASAGEYAGFTVIASSAPLIEMALITLVINARYLLMSTAISQKLPSGIHPFHRLGVAYFITDEIFAIETRQPGELNPWYPYGAGFIAAPMWAAGTAIGIMVGNLMPVRLVSALSVALFGMFLAVIIPPARKEKSVLGLVIVSFAASYAAARLPYLKGLSAGNRIILLTVLLSAAAAVLFPRKPEAGVEHDEAGHMRQEEESL